jgi:hypothetical protein
VFAYIDELSALSVEGYAQEQSRAAGERDRLRRRVVELLLDPAVDEAAVRAAAAEAAWVAPETAAALVWRGSRSRLRARLPAGTPVLEGDEEGETTVAILADPEAPELADRLTRAAGRDPLVLGPTVELTAVGESAARARRVLALITNGAIEASGLVRAAEQLGALVAHGDEEALAELAGARLAPLEAETPASRRRLVETLRAWLDAQGEVAAVAARLHVHPQTVRYRMARLRELFGEALTDPEARLELALALRSPVSANM